MNKPFLASFKSIALIQTAFIGDVALTLPLATKIKQINTNSILSFITTPQAAEIPTLSKDIDNVIIYDKKVENKGLKGLLKFIDNIGRNKFDCIISPHRSFRTTLLTKLLNPEFSVSFNKSSLSFLYSKSVDYKIHYHEKQRNLSLLSVFSDFDENYNLNPEIILSIKDSDIEFVNRILIERNISTTDYILIAPGSVWETKKWKESYFIELIKLLNASNFQSILIGSKNDAELCSRIAEKSQAINIAGLTTIPQTIALMKKAKIVITNDSGPIHFAGLANCRTIAFFGPTTPKFGFAPTGNYDVIIENDNLKCRPCTIHGGNSCPLGTHECMTTLKPEKVFDKIQSITDLNHF